MLDSGAGTALPVLRQHSWEKFTVPLRPCIMDRTAAAPTRRVSSLPQFNISTSTLAFDQHFTTNAKGILLLAEILTGMLVWILIGGTDYFRLSTLCWVMFVSILLWILTICLFIIYLTGVHSRIPQIPWTTLSLCFNCAAAALYLVTAVVEAFCVGQATRGRHNYNCWAASAVSAQMSMRALLVFASLLNNLRRGCAWSLRDPKVDQMILTEAERGQLTASWMMKNILPRCCVDFLQCLM
ncbi:CKLF-like MARVEL transmembrane domain-containing protein 8 isoform X1 [Xiphophorus maculatus]|uniref:CKLF-like MARVEL transmembrane domain-containing protein 8 isoform X1 n=1 Tax=Xiphophorus maculatus TaxID=8083 RepID=UPI000C6EDB5C|nr:CKLF-like MARVEL transmembrane domain-containing protein 8 isoform X1 [Xiphophorus maculatus]